MQPSPPKFDVAVYVGRFQPFHNGHLALLQRALALAPLCVVVIGSANQARTPKNPFTWAERAEMIGQALEPNDRARVRVRPVRDHSDQARGVAAVRTGVAGLVATEGKRPRRRVVLVGHFKDATSEYLRGFPGWAVESVARVAAADGTQLRNALFSGAALSLEPTLQATLAPPLAAFTGQVPQTTLDFLRAWVRLPCFERLAHEWRMLNEYHASWARAPYPPVFVTVDAVVRCAGHVLLIRRAHAPGVGLLAVPGGFIEQRETAYQSCLRELKEETRLRVPDETLRQCLKANAVFDHPDRSLRGRTITHAFYFDLGERELPEVQADDDAQSVQWLPVEHVLAAEDQFHDDHFHMLDHFLGLTEA